MTVLAHDIVSYPEAARAVGATFSNLDTLLCSSDIITVHVPFSEGTRNMIGEAELGRMKHTCVLVNTSRGGVVDENALCKYLKEGQIGGAGVDVFASEPLPLTHCLVSAPNCVLTPHIGARTRETIRFMGLETARNILSVLNPLPSGTRS
jgi:phosphoglycerate dehydrogenase-like enzyme